MRQKKYKLWDLVRLFQSTHPRRVRQIVVTDSEGGRSISIHAPAKGATKFPVPFRFLLLHFNPRTREGCDFLIALFCLVLGLFQSTHPRRVRRGGLLLKSQIDYISIHAPAKGATVTRWTFGTNFQISIHAPAKGATILKVQSLTYKEISIHAPAKGATEANRRAKRVK